MGYCGGSVLDIGWVEVSRVFGVGVVSVGCLENSKEEVKRKGTTYLNTLCMRF